MTPAGWSSPSFTATHPDHCHHCDQPITPGQPIHYDTTHHTVHDTCQEPT